MSDLYWIDAPASSVYVKDWNASPFNMAELVRRGVLVPVGKDDGSEAFANINQAVDRWKSWVKEDSV